MGFRTQDIGNIIHGEVYEIETKYNGLVNCYFISDELKENKLHKINMLDEYKG